MCGALYELTKKMGIPFIYKSSFDKANRTSLNGVRGMGIDKTLAVFADLKKEFGIPMITDIHTEAQCAEAAAVVDVLQIPAFLCRQTDLLIAAAKTGAVINIKKGQFLAPQMAETGYPVIMDATHSVQQPGGQGSSSGGDRTMVPVIARAAVAVGVAGLFMEVHQDPDNAPSDGPNMVKLAELPGILETLQKLDGVIKG